MCKAKIKESSIGARADSRHDTCGGLLAYLLNMRYKIDSD